MPCLNSIKFPPPMDNASRRDSWEETSTYTSDVVSFTPKPLSFFFSHFGEEEASEN